MTVPDPEAVKDGVGRRVKEGGILEVLVRTALVALLLVGSLPASGADPIEQRFAARGPHQTVFDLATGPGGAFSLFRPSQPGAGGTKHPVITWGNGTLTIPLFYFWFLDHLASHGFVVIASNSPFTGSGKEMIEGVDWVLQQNQAPDSPLFGAIDAASIGATGHSQGGGGAINAGNDPRVACTAPIQPAPGKVTGLAGPMFVVAGESDFIVPAPFVEAAVARPSPVATIFGILSRATHFEPLLTGGGYRGYVTAWFAACLSHDVIARKAFVNGCSLCRNERWEVFRKRAKRDVSQPQGQ